MLLLGEANLISKSVAESFCGVLTLHGEQMDIMTQVYRSTAFVAYLRKFKPGVSEISVLDSFFFNYDCKVCFLSRQSAADYLSRVRLKHI